MTKWKLRRATINDVEEIADCFKASYTAGYPYGLLEPDNVRASIQDPKRAVWAG